MKPDRSINEALETVPEHIWGRHRKTPGQNHGNYVSEVTINQRDRDIQHRHLNQKIWQHMRFTISGWNFQIKIPICVLLAWEWKEFSVLVFWSSHTYTKMVFLTEINRTVRFQFVTDYIDNADDGPCLCHIKRLLFLTEWLLCFQLRFLCSFAYDNICF